VPLTVEGHPRTLSGPSPDLSPARPLSLSVHEHRLLIRRFPGGLPGPFRSRTGKHRRSAALSGRFRDDGRVVTEHVDRVWWRRALLRARRIFSPLWSLTWPLRAAMPRMMTRAYAKILAPGERVLAVDLSLGRSVEDYWIVTTRAVYILPTPSRANQRAGRTRGRRFPFSAIRGISEIERGAFVERTMNLISDVDGTAEVITELIDTTFKGKVVAAIECQLTMNTGKDWRPDGQ
jgi:hypothetical protein